MKRCRNIIQGYFAVPKQSYLINSWSKTDYRRKLLPIHSAFLQFLLSIDLEIKLIAKHCNKIYFSVFWIVIRVSVAYKHWIKKFKKYCVCTAKFVIDSIQNLLPSTLFLLFQRDHSNESTCESSDNVNTLHISRYHTDRLQRSKTYRGVKVLCGTKCHKKYTTHHGKHWK